MGFVLIKNTLIKISTIVTVSIVDDYISINNGTYIIRFSSKEEAKIVFIFLSKDLQVK
mgnify:CR=1 FL=1